MDYATDAACLLLLMEDAERRESLQVTSPRFDFDSYPPQNFVAKFRFTKTELTELAQLLHLPDEFPVGERSRIRGIDALCITLRRLSYPGTYHSLSDFAGWSVSSLSKIFDAVMTFLYEFCKDNMAFDAAFLTVARRVRYASIMTDARCPMDGCWGLIDGTVRPNCRPTKGQQALYNGHKKQHALKYQGVVTPDGLIVSLAGPFEGRAHDMTMLSESQLLSKIENLDQPEGGPHLHIFGDQGYVNSPQLLTPYGGLNLSAEQAEFNKVMSELREPVEWAFKDIIQNWAFLDFKKNLKVMAQPIATYYIVGAFLWNCLACVRGSQTADYFQCDTPSLGEYLGSLEEDHAN